MSAESLAGCMAVEYHKPAAHRSAHLAGWHEDLSSRWGVQRATSQSFGVGCHEGSPFAGGAFELHAAMEEFGVVVMNRTWAAAWLVEWTQATL